MRFRNYMVLNESVNDIFNILTRDCSEFIKEVYGNGFTSFFYRGTSKNIEGIKKIVPRVDRKPLDSPREFHFTFDRAFKKKFGWRARSEGVFVTCNERVAEDYGSAYEFFPADGYKYIWSKDIVDLFSGEFHSIMTPLYGTNISIFKPEGLINIESDAFYRIGPEMANNKLRSGIYRDFFKNKWIKNSEEYEKILEDWIEHEKNKIVDDAVKTYRSDGLGKLSLLNYENEVMFKCSYYYLIGMTTNITGFELIDKINSYVNFKF